MTKLMLSVALMTACTSDPAFDVAYPKEWTRSVDDPVPFDLLVINTSDAPLDMSTLALESVTTDHPTATVHFILPPLDTTIASAHAGGYIAPIAEPVFSALVPEPRTDTDTRYLDWELLNAPESTYDLTVDAVLTLNSVDIPLHFFVHMVPGPVIYADPLEATRTELYR